VNNADNIDIIVLIIDTMAFNLTVLTIV
jgi:hypothetical protein